MKDLILAIITSVPLGLILFVAAAVYYLTMQ